MRPDLTWSYQDGVAVAPTVACILSLQVHARRSGRSGFGWRPIGTTRSSYRHVTTAGPSLCRHLKGLPTNLVLFVELTFRAHPTIAATTATTATAATAATAVTTAMIAAARILVTVGKVANCPQEEKRRYRPMPALVEQHGSTSWPRKVGRLYN